MRYSSACCCKLNNNILSATVLGAALAWRGSLDFDPFEASLVAYSQVQRSQKAENPLYLQDLQLRPLSFVCSNA